jgi:hypothetical protein
LWLIVSTIVLALTSLVLAVAETNLWAHYLIDGGEFLSLIGLAFIGMAGVYLFRTQRLFVSLPLVAPWLLYPVITQGDQIIDNLSINQMRWVCHILLAAIFAMPVAVVVLGVRYLIVSKAGAGRNGIGWVRWLPGGRQMAQGHVSLGSGLLAVTLLAGEICVAYEFLGILMVITVLSLILTTVVCVALGARNSATDFKLRGPPTERFALILLAAGVLGSATAYFGFKHRPGAYQGSPSAFMDPGQKNAFYPLGIIAVRDRAPKTPAHPESVERALNLYGQTIERLAGGYHILDRNYTYDFHNQLFLRKTPLLAGYRTAGLKQVEEARQLATEAQAAAAEAKHFLEEADPIRALVEDVQGYVEFNLRRAPVLGQMSGEFEKTAAGLQHAAHLYEGESKALGVNLQALLRKHQRVLDSPATSAVTAQFVRQCHQIYRAYAHHVVGF